MMTETHIHTDPENTICDFCSRKDPCWQFVIPAEGEIGTDVIAGKELHSMDADGLWAACDTCKVLIVQRNNAELARHSVESFYHKFPFIPERERPNVIARVRQAHNFFFARWDGSDPRKVDNV